MGKAMVIAVGANLLMGIPGIVPVWLLWYLSSNGPLADIGLTQREPTENDGMLPWLLFGGLVVLPFILAWWIVNWALRRRTRQGGWVFWPVSALATLAPTFALMIAL